MAPPWTNAWDETKPADTDLANTLGTQGRQHKLDSRQRLDYQHVFGVNVNDDGGHRFVSIASAYHPANTESFKAAGFSLTAANAQSFIDLAGTWNTSGTPTAIKLNVLDSASNAASLLMDLKVGGVSKFSVSKTGAVISGVPIAGAIAAYATSNVAIFNTTNTTMSNTGISTALTPTSAAHKMLVLITAQVQVSANVISNLVYSNAQLKRNGVVIRSWNSIAFAFAWNFALAGGGSLSGLNGGTFFSNAFVDSPGIATPCTYTFEVAVNNNANSNSVTWVNIDVTILELT